ncbi:MAG: four-carbon acid sugar kinase family protein [Rhizobiaceae bacterium]|nr:four-carbon acid sugar kinase family protein [Rhizobiaceae bacterium]
MPVRTFAAIADDLTGGMELAAMLVARGVKCSFVTSPELATEDDEEAIVVAQKIRTVPAEEATAAVRTSVAALRHIGARQYFYKYCATFDSTPAGNIGPCVDAMAEMLDVGQTLFVPAFPEVGRAVFHGHLFLGNQLLSESPKRHDPLTPMTDPNLVRVLQAQTREKVGLLSIEALQGGPERSRAELAQLKEQGFSRIIADTITDDDLDRIAALTADWTLMTGNSTIAGHYPAVWRKLGWIADGANAAPLPCVDSPGIVVAGSCSERTIEQLHAFEAHRPVIWVDLIEASRRDMVGELADAAAAMLSEGPVAIATSGPPEKVAAIQASLGVRGAATVAEEVLSGVAANLRGRGVRRILVAGGETSGAVMDALGIKRLRVGPYEAAGLARAISGDGDVALCLKSGKLGPVDMFLPMLERMRTGGQ